MASASYDLCSGDDYNSHLHYLFPGHWLYTRFGHFGHRAQPDVSLHRAVVGNDQHKVTFVYRSHLRGADYPSYCLAKTKIARKRFEIRILND